MLKISDGRTQFFQWDMNQKLIVRDSAITQVHYHNKIDEDGLVVDVVDGCADVPNIYLTECWTIHAYAFDGNKVRYEAAFKVEPRAKPLDYVYTQTEVHTWEELDKKIDTLVGIDMSDYYTKSEVDAALENVEVDLTDYYTKSEVDKKIEGIDVDVDLSDYYTKSEVDKAIAEIDVDVDLSNYYTKSEVDKAIADVDLSNYYTKPQVDALIPSLDGYAKTADIPDVSGFITEEALADFVTLADVEEQGYQTAADVETAIEEALSKYGNAEDGAY